MDIISASHHVYYIIAGVSATAALAIAIVRGLHHWWRKGAGAGIGTFFGFVFFSILIVNAVGIRDWGNTEFQKDTGIHSDRSSVYGR